MSIIRPSVAVWENTPQEVVSHLMESCEVLVVSGKEGGLRTILAQKPWAAVIRCNEKDRHDLPFRVADLTRSAPSLKAVIIAPGLDDDTGRKTFDAGAFDIFSEEPACDDLLASLRRALYHYKLQRPEDLLDKKGSSIIGSSPRISEFLKKLEKVASVDVPVLIQGESGTGKELAALSIHGSSRRKDGPFAVINCGAIPEPLLEAELFGYERGAFTGADVARKGKIEYAMGGTLFLDEIGELSPRLQAKLLRFLQEKKIERLGGRFEMSVDARVISATNRDVKSMIHAGAFREDLYFRLGVINLVTPPLRERGDDVLTLALFFLKKYAKEYKRPVQGFTQEAVSCISSYQWPGNIRELQNRIKGAVALCASRHVGPEDLMFAHGEGSGIKTASGFLEANNSFKKRLVQESLLKNNGIVTKAASELGISRQYLSRLIARFNLNVE